MTISRKKPLQSITATATATAGSWDLNIPLDILYEILSCLGLKANIIASAVCKTWLEVGVSVRNSQPRPLFFYPSDDGNYILLDPSRSTTYNLNFPDLKDTTFYCSKDGWLLVSRKSSSDLIFFLNPLTRERIYLPKGSCYSKDGYCLAFSAAPTSTSCLVISLSYTRFQKGITYYSVINTCQLGESVWTTHHLEHPLACHYRGFFYFWDKCLFSNGIFYCLSPLGSLGVFDPSRETWNILQVKRFQVSLSEMLRTEHEGDMFVTSTGWGNNNSAVFKLNLQRNVL